MLGVGGVFYFCSWGLSWQEAMCCFPSFLWLSSDRALSMSTFRALACVVTTRPVHPPTSVPWSLRRRLGEVRCAERSLLTVWVWFELEVLGSVKTSWNWSILDKVQGLIQGPGLPLLLWESWYPTWQAVIVVNVCIKDPQGSGRWFFCFDQVLPE